MMDSDNHVDADILNPPGPAIEGLDCEIEFFTLLAAIFLSFARLGRRAELAKCKKRFME